MSRAASGLLGFFLLSAGGARAADPGKAFYADVLAYADWCRSEGLAPEARRAYLYLLETLAGKGSADDVAVGAQRGLAALAADPLLAEKAGARTVHRERVREMLSRGSARYMEKAEALRGSDLAKAEEAVRAALVIDTDCAAARAWRGEKRSDGFGWVPADEAARLSANAVSLSRLPPPAVWAAEDAKHRRWEDAWVLLTPRYAIRSNRPLAEVVECGRLCEMLYAAFFELARGACDRPAGRLGICYLADKADYDRFLAEAVKDGGFTPHNVVGFYDHVRRICILQHRGGSSREGGAVSRDEATLLHEGVHQLVHLGHLGGFPTRLPFLQPAPTNQIHFWAVEGIACLFEASRVEGGKLLLNRDGARYSSLAKRFAKGWRPGLSQWMSMSQARFMDQSAVAANYEMSAAFTHFLVHCADGRKYRSKFFKLLSSCYEGEVGLETFNQVFRARYDVLEGEFEAYVRETWPLAAAREGE